MEIISKSFLHLEIAASESRPHGRSLAVEDDRGRNDPFEDMTGFEEQKEEKEEKVG